MSGSEFVLLLLGLSIPYAAVVATIGFVADDVDRGKQVSGQRAAARVVAEGVLVLTAVLVAVRYGNGWWIIAAPVVWYRLPEAARTAIGASVLLIYALWWNWGVFLR